MFYFEGLEEVVFSRHEICSEEPDEIIIISGFLGPSPIERLSELPMKATVIGGMYPSGIDARLLNSLNNAKTNNPNLSIYFTKQEIHSTIYIWKKSGKILCALIGSANFSSNGLRTDYRESLADATRDTYVPLESYYKFILDQSSEEPILNKNQEIIDFSTENTELNDSQENTESLEINYSYQIPLNIISLGEKIIPTASGLNWGRARLMSGAHVAAGDAYIRLPKDILKEDSGLIDPFDKEYTTPDGKRKRNSDPIELIWDDGTTMPASLEGSQNFEGRNYPKQLASYSSKQPFLNGERISKKSILGRYLRNRLGVDVDQEITIDTLKKYGRDTVTLSRIEEGIYYADFSVK